MSAHLSPSFSCHATLDEATLTSPFAFMVPLHLHFPSLFFIMVTSNRNPKSICFLVWSNYSCLLVIPAAVPTGEGLVNSADRIINVSV